MPGMPTDDISTQYLDESTDNVQQARAEIHALAIKVKAILAAFDQADGMARLDSQRKLPVNRLYMGASSGLDADTLRGKSDAAFAPSSHVGSRGNQHGVATTSEAGFMSRADKAKLDSLAASPDYVDGSLLLWPEMQRDITVSSSTRIFELHVPRDGLVRVRYGGTRPPAGSISLWMRVYRNGAAALGSRVINNLSDQWDETLTVSAGDLIQLYCWGNNNRSVDGNVHMAVSAGNPSVPARHRDY